MTTEDVEIETRESEPPSRSALRRARRVLVKAGTSVVATPNGTPSLVRMGAIAEQISELISDGVEVIFVSSGAVGMGKRLLRKQGRMRMSLDDLSQERSMGSSAGGGGGGEAGRSRSGSTVGPLPRSGSSLLRGGESVPPSPHGVGRTESFVSLLEISRKSSCRIEEADKKKQYDSACAAAGQFDMMNLYSSLFNQMDISASQILVTQADFMDPDRLRNLSYTISRLCGLGILPIINENDAVSANLGYTDEDVFSDNDSLAALCARSFDCEVALLLTDVGGVYDRPPGEDGSELISLWRRDSDVLIGETSSQGECFRGLILFSVIPFRGCDHRGGGGAGGGALPSLSHAEGNSDREENDACVRT